MSECITIMADNVGHVVLTRLNASTGYIGRDWNLYLQDSDSKQDLLFSANHYYMKLSSLFTFGFSH